MTFYYRHIYLILFCFLFLPCCTKLKNEKLFLEENTIKIIERGQKVINNNYVKIFEIGNFGNFYFGAPTKIVFYNNLLYILDPSYNCIFVLSKKGEFIGKYGDQGKGPGEFSMLKDFVINNDVIYCLDKGKFCISKFTLDFELLWERKISNEILENISPENLSIYKNNLLISGFSNSYYDVKGRHPILYMINENMEILDNYMTLSKYFKGKSFEDKMLYSANLLANDNNTAYIGILIGPNILYSLDLSNHQFKYKIIKEPVGSERYMKFNKGKGGMELLSLYNITAICITNNYIVLSEEAGGFSQSPEDLPKNYYNNISFYSKEGRYLFSFQDRSIPYSVYGIYCAVEEFEDGFYLYITSPESCKLYKYKLNNIK